MNKLFAHVLSKKDLSKAGELFSFSDSDIESDLEDIVEQIIVIADSEEYEKNDNDQSVVEICITRITTAIRETERIGSHAQALVRILFMCHRHNLTQVTKDEDPPHAKIASDIMSRLFTYYTNKKVMACAIPAVVKFLDCDNKDLVRSVASYLSLATIDNADLLAEHMPSVLNSLLKGNYLLGQLMPQIYELNPTPVIKHVDDLARLLKQCDATEKVCFIQLLNKVAKTHPELLEKHVSQLCSYLGLSLISPMVLTILVEMAAARPAVLIEHLADIQAVVETQPALTYQVAQITGSVGSVSSTEGLKAMNYLVCKLPAVDQSTLPSVLQEIQSLGLIYPGLLQDNLDAICRQSRNGTSAARLMIQKIKEDVRRNNSKSSDTSLIHKSQSSVHSEKSEAGRVAKKAREVRSVSCQTEGTVTIITVGNPPNAIHPSGTVSVKTTALPPSGASSQQSLAKFSNTSSAGPAISPTPEASPYNSVGTSTDNITQSESIRDGVQLFCEKHFTKIKSFISILNATIPLPVKCSVVNGKHKRFLKLHFRCSQQSSQCLYSGSYFTLNTRLPKSWVHLMFLSVQAQSMFALSQKDVDVSCLKFCWDALKGDSTSSFLALVTSSFPAQKEQLALLQELHQMRYYDVFELNAAQGHWACFMCNHPEKVSKLLNDGCPEIAGQLKEKKGKWKFFKRWKTRYFTLAGGSISYDKSNATKATLPVTKIRSVKAVRKGIRDIPKAFEIFTGDQTYRFKAKAHHNVEQWVQCLHIAVARSQTGGDSVASSETSAPPAPRGGGSGSEGHPASRRSHSRRYSAEGGGSGGASGSHSRYHSHGAGSALLVHEKLGAYDGLFHPKPQQVLSDGVVGGAASCEAGRVVTDTKL